MTNKKVTVLVALIALFASVMGGFIVYAALSSQLEIKGSAEFQPESWNVRFKGSSLVPPTLVNGGLTGGASIDTAPTLTDTAIQNFKVILTNAGDSAKYTFYIENTGSLDAVLSTYTYTSPSCTGTAPTALADQAIVCGSNLIYTFKYVGGDLATNGLASGANVASGDSLKQGTEVQVELKIEYALAAVQLPTNNVTIGGLDKTLIYTVAP